MQKALPYLLVLCLSIGCSRPTGFDYKGMTNFTLTPLASGKASVKMDLEYFNPNPYGLKLKNVNCEIFVDSALVGTYTLDTLMQIGARSSFTVPAHLQVDLQQLYKNGLNFLFNNSVLIGAKGTTKVGKGGFYVTIPFSYEGKEQLRLF